MTTTKRRPITDTEYAQFLERAKHVGPVKAAKELERPDNSFYHRMNRDGIRIVRNPSSYAVDSTQFERILRPEVAYVLGLLWADGHIRPRYNEIGIELNQVDALTVRPVFERLGTWHYDERIRAGRSKSIARLHMSNPVIHRLLVEWGYLTKSVGTPTSVLQVIPDHLHPLFWRGYLDGDGCLYTRDTTHQLSFSGSYEQDWTAQIAMCASLGVKTSTDQWVNDKGHRSSLVRVTARMDVEKVCDWIYRSYEDDGIGLTRKHDKYLLIKAACDQSRRGRFAKWYAAQSAHPVDECSK